MTLWFEWWARWWAAALTPWLPREQERPQTVYQAWDWGSGESYSARCWRSTEPRRPEPQRSAEIIQLPRRQGVQKPHN